MRKEYGFSKAQKKPYASRLKRQVTLRMDEVTITTLKPWHRKMASLTSR